MVASRSPAQCEEMSNQFTGGARSPMAIDELRLLDPLVSEGADPALPNPAEG